MLRVSIDNQESTISAESMANLELALSELNRQIPSDRVVTRVIVDGTPIPHDKPSELQKKELIATSQLEVRTADRGIWSINGVDISLSRVEQVRRSLIPAAELFREGAYVDANRFFIRCLEGLERFLEALLVTKLAMQLDFQKISVEGTTLARIEQNLSEILKSTLSYQQRRDYEGVADKVEYELLTNLSQWTKALSAIQAERSSNA